MGTRLELNGWELGGGANKRETFASDVEAFIGYLESNYELKGADKKLRDKFFHVRDSLPKAIKKHYDGIELARLNARKPIPLMLAQIASHASRFADADHIVLEPDSEGKWELRVIRSSDDYHLVITAESIGEYSVCGSEDDGRTLYNCASHGIELLNSYFGKRNLGTARKIGTMFYVTANVHYYKEWGDDNRTVENFIVSYPFATREEAETHKASLEQRKEFKFLNYEFLPSLDIDYVDRFEVVEPKV